MVVADNQAGLDQKLNFFSIGLQDIDADIGLVLLFYQQKDLNIKIEVEMSDPKQKNASRDLQLKTAQLKAKCRP